MDDVLRFFAVGFASLPMIAVAIALARIFCTAVDAIGRNPEARDAIFPVVMLGAAFTEALALFSMLIAFLILYR